MANKKIDIPHKFVLRPYQESLWDYMVDDKPNKRAVWIAHRRAGKDKTMLNIMIRKMFQRIGTYAYFFPTFTQGRRVLWDGMDKDGFRFMDHFPKEVVKRKNATTMTIELINGSIFQVLGTDNYNSIVGANVIGSVFSEYSLQDPRAWGFIRPMLAENGGWAIFNYTPRGHNHGFDLLKLAQNQTDWYVEILDVNKTNAIPAEVLVGERQEMLRLSGSDALYQQEYMCDFSVPVQGAYYVNELTIASEQGRITKVPYEMELPVHTAWDLGVGDATAIWFYQVVGGEVRVIDYYEDEGEGMLHYFKVLKEKGYVYGEHYAPHDIAVREFTMGKARIDIAREVGINFRIVPRLGLDDGIMSTRLLFNRMWFDETKCERGLECLKNYHKEYDDKNKVYRDHPLHDWASNGADAFRYLCLSVQSDVYVKDKPSSEYRIETEGFDPYE